VSLGLPRRVYWGAWWLIKQTKMRQIKRDKKGFKYREEEDEGIRVKFNMNHEGNITLEHPLCKEE